jgi:hypothetical protein
MTGYAEVIPGDPIRAITSGFVLADHPEDIAWQLESNAECDRFHG